jgi:peptidase E
MTKYILHGGETGIKCKSNSNFFEEISKSIKEPIKILAVYFSRPKEEWGDLFKNDKVNFSSNANGKKVELILASENRKEFIEQIKNADAVYIRGGKPNLLKEQLNKIKNLKELFKGKTIAGSSAGAMVLSKYAHSRSSVKPFLGLAILPIKIVVHYSQSMKNKLEDLENYGSEKMKIYAIPETEFIILNK